MSFTGGGHTLFPQILSLPHPNRYINGNAQISIHGPVLRITRANNLISLLPTRACADTNAGGENIYTHAYNRCSVCTWIRMHLPQTARPAYSYRVNIEKRNRYVSRSRKFVRITRLKENFSCANEKKEGKKGKVSLISRVSPIHLLCERFIL